METRGNTQVAGNENNGSPSFPLVGKWLGYGGVIPFVALALNNALGLDVLNIADPTVKLLGYGAVIISFIGAVHWGVALQADRSRQTRLFIYSVLPALAAWGWFFAAAKTALIGMALTIVVLFFVDRFLFPDLLPSGYLKMRLHLTIIVATCLLLASIGVA